MSNKRKKVKGGAGTRKYYRNEAKCALYRSQKKREKSHIRRIEKHLAHHIKDKQARKALRRYQDLLK